jgi:glycosyltransferase involved in cell wall biosynthesis
MSYSLIIPIFNEEATLEGLLGQLKDLDNKIEIIIVNDGSTDNTKSILETQKAFKIIHNKMNRGKGFAIAEGAKHASKDNFILMDGDLEIDMSCIPIIINEYELNPNTVTVGSRWEKESMRFNKKHLNTYGNFLINYIFNFLYKTNLNDVLCCVKIINNNLFKSLKLESLSFSVEMELMSKLALINTKFHQVKIKYKRRKKSEGKKLKISDGWGILWKMVSLRFKK